MTDSSTRVCASIVAVAGPQGYITAGEQRVDDPHGSGTAQSDDCAQMDQI
ncbi:MAG: hypothetical protein ACLQFR_28570 [Streptosporangiaceae bacterium]